MTSHLFRRTWAYLWAAPTTAVGLVGVLLTLCTGGKIQLHTGVIEANGGFTRFFLRNCTPLPGGASAITLGHVVLGTDKLALTQTRSHERVHVAQVERWGPLFIPAYLVASLVCLLRGRHFYRDNPFEVEAFNEPGDRD